MTSQFAATPEGEMCPLTRAENVMPYGILGLLILVLDIYVIYLIVTGSGDAGIKLVWVIVVLLLPLIGPILYLVIGRGKVR